MKIQILVDHRNRDLKANTLVGAILAKKGAQVILTPTAIMEKDIFELNADHIVFNYLRSNNEHLISKVLKCNKCASVLDTEGGFFVKLVNENNIPNFMKTFPLTNKTSTRVSNYFVWGKDVYDFLKTTDYFSRTGLKLTGTPRTDIIYRSSLSETQRDVILINTSFTLANPKYKTPEEEANYLINAYKYDANLTLGVLNSQKKIMEEYVELAIKVSKGFPEKKIILRPHPFESCTFYQKHLSHCPNITITNKETIDEALSKAKLLIHYQCSTAMEAMLLKIPALSLSHGANVRSIETINHITDYHESHDSLLKSITDIFNGNYVICPIKTKYLNESIEKIYFKFDNSSSSRVANHLLETPLQKSNLIFRFYRYFYLLIAIVKYFIKSCLGKNNFDEAKYFTEQDVNSDLASLKYHDLKARKLKNSVVLEPYNVE
jgi:surface carbohydrate biosynthesis protein